MLPRTQCDVLNNPALLPGVDMANISKLNIPNFQFDVRKVLPHSFQAQSAASLEELSKTVAEAAEAKSAKGFVKRILGRIQGFEAALDPDQEVGIRLVSFGQTVTIHVDNLGYIQPSLIVFSGRTNDGQIVELVQHVSQISFLLMKLPRLSAEEPRKPIGFHVL